MKSVKTLKNFFEALGAASRTVLGVILAVALIIAAAAVLQGIGSKVFAVAQNIEGGHQKDISILHYYGEETGVYYQFPYPRGEVTGTKLVPEWAVDIDNEFLETETEFVGFVQVFPQVSGEIKIVLKDRGGDGVPPKEITQGFFPSDTSPKEIALAISNHQG